jgi:HPt (histidine-containing phosphotransfer) domain-containing protein/anti-sigma regulatory factor (Ser/Thr protein kinase)
MRKVLNFLLLPAEITDFERHYLARVNRIALIFLVLHLPAFVLLAWLHDTGPALATLLTSAVLSGPLLARQLLKNPRSVSVIYGIAAMFMGGLLVHFGQGPVQIEMHFYFFALIAMCAVFGNPMVIVAAAATVVLHHLVVWLVLPRSVFNYAAAWWVVGVHAAFVAFESVAACFISRTFFDDVIGLEKIVHSRTEALDSKNRDMRLLLDNVQQGFLTIDLAGVLAQERSAVVDAWFGAPERAASWFDYLATLSPSFSEQTRFAWDQVVAGFMPPEVTIGQMPQRLTWNMAHYHVEYRPIGVSEPHARYLVIITDVTTEVGRERAELDLRETLSLFEGVLSDRSGVESLLQEGGNIVDGLVNECSHDSSVVKRSIHTLKGNALMYGLGSIAAQCHALEDWIAEERVLPPARAYEALRERWTKLASDIETLLCTRSASVEIDEAQYSALEAAAECGESGTKLLRRVRGLKLEATAKRLKHFQEQAKRIAERLDKGDICVEIEDHGVRLDARRWAGFWGAFAHALRNALDHGLETVEDRVAAGKTAPGTVALRTFEEKERLIIEIADDGRGIDWERVATRAARAGLPATSSHDLERALFVDGISTAAAITEISGRGVGMGALLSATEELGGSLSIESTLHQGTTMRFSFPISAQRGPDPAQPSAIAN